METKTVSCWKVMLDEALSNEAANLVVHRALAEADRAELIMFLGELYDEYIGPDPFGGESGTLERIGVICEKVSPTPSELAGASIDKGRLECYLSRRG